MPMKNKLTNMTTAAFFNSIARLAPAAVLLAALAPAAQAEAGNPLNDTVSVSLAAPSSTRIAISDSAMRIASESTATGA